jgi:hypothetical protein
MGHQNDVSVWHSGNKLPLQETVGYVQSLLQTAIEVEHSTIPLYLTTMYSILNQSSFEALTMRGVVMEGAPRPCPLLSPNSCYATADTC